MSVPQGIKLTHLPALLLDYHNLKAWLHLVTLMRTIQLQQSNRPPPRIKRPPVIPPRRRFTACTICHRVGHLPSQCKQYYCMHCETSAPGHFAKFCPRNPYQGIAEGIYPQMPWQYSMPRKIPFIEFVTSSYVGPSSNQQPNLPTSPHTTTKPKDRIIQPTSNDTTPRIYHRHRAQI